jgi:hypothetical protein
MHKGWGNGAGLIQCVFAHVRYRGICWEQKDTERIVPRYLRGGTIDRTGRRGAREVRVTLTMESRVC